MKIDSKISFETNISFKYLLVETKICQDPYFIYSN